ncbi:MAG: YigZ family protein [Clostridia bacterium]|nr:YigZ family protein [Clostridia bacterium]
MQYYTLVNNYKADSKEIGVGELYEKKSKFFSYIYPIANSDDAKKYIHDIKEQNKEARHCVYIYSYLEDGKINIKFSDDGEPQGTGTKAIYELITKETLTNICIIIVRYFGGILLGAGPLSRAYLNCARLSIKQCKKEQIYKYIHYHTLLEYTDFSKIKDKLDEYVMNNQVIVKNILYQDKVEIDIHIREDLYKKIIEQLK